MGTPDGGYGIPEGTAEFRILPRQRRSLLIGTVGLVAIAVVGWLIVFGTKSWGFAGNIAAGTSLGLPIYLYCYIVYGIAYTRFGPAGISVRTLTSRYEYRWEQIGNVARRAYTNRGVTTYTVILTTTDGDRIRLGAPVSGGIMGDPEFEVKYARIRGAWQAATGRTGPEDDTKSIWTRGLVLLTAGIIVQVVAGVAFAAILATNGPALRAREGMGTRGMFTPEIQNCPQLNCTWFGEFTANWSTKYATLAPGGPTILGPGTLSIYGSVSLPAIDTGAQDTVYPAGGGTAWEAPAAGLAAAGGIVIILLVLEIAVPLYLGHRRRARARDGLARLGLPAR